MRAVIRRRREQEKSDLNEPQRGEGRIMAGIQLGVNLEPIFAWHVQDKIETLPDLGVVAHQTWLL